MNIYEHVNILNALQTEDIRYHYIYSNNINHFLFDFIINSFDYENANILTYNQRLLIEAMFYCSQIYFFNTNYGLKISNLNLSFLKGNNHSKIKKSLFFLLKIIFDYYSKKLIIQILSLFQYLLFLKSSRIGYTIPDLLFSSFYSIINNNTKKDKENNLIVNTNQIFIQKMIWNELNKLLKIFFPMKRLFFSFPLLKKAEDDKCVICKKELTNIISFSCGHKYCYYCYMINSNKKEKNVCYICNK